MIKTVEQLRDYCHPVLDRIENKYEQIRIAFFGSESDFPASPVVVITIDIPDGIAKVASTRCLPTRDWIADALAYKRAAEFVLNTGLKTK